MNEQLKFLSPEWFRAEALKYVDTEAEKQTICQQFCDEFNPDKLSELNNFMRTIQKGLW